MTAAKMDLDVKELEWVLQPGGRVSAGSLIGAYIIVPSMMIAHFKMSFPRTSEWEYYDTVDEAKAAAQADFNRHILSAISAPNSTEPKQKKWTVAGHIKDADPEWLRQASFATILDRPPQPSLRVKTLEWRDGYRDAGCRITQVSPIPFYQIRELDGVVWLDVDNHQTIYPSVDLAKAAAQADYESRIRAAVATSEVSADV